MGRSVTPKYRVEFRDNHLAGGITAPDGISRVDRKPVKMMGWRRAEDGSPTAANLESWRKDYNRSFGPNGANAHIGVAFGSIPHIHFARLVRQSDDAVIAETTMPTFEAL